MQCRTVTRESSNFFFHLKWLDVWNYMSMIRFRYRLVRHMWQLNVNESLCMGASCSIGNMATGELGVDVNIKNLNQVHHPLMTEIMLNDISLFSPTYQINSKKVICKCRL